MDTQYCAQSNFGGPVFNFTHGQGAPMQYPDGQYRPMYPSYHGLQYMYPPQGRGQLIRQPDGLVDGKTESKPRLSKEEVEKLEKVFQENPKPSSSVKAQLADGLGLERPRINNWFQNRRAKAKQERKQEEYEARRAAEKAASESNSPEDGHTGVSDIVGDGSPQRKHSSALFPDMIAATSTASDGEAYDDDEDATAESDIYDSPFVAQSVKKQQDEFSPDFQSPLSLDFSQPDNAGYAYNGNNFGHQDPAHEFNQYVAGQRSPMEQMDQSHVSEGLVDGLPRDEGETDNFLQLPALGFPASSVGYYQNAANTDESKPPSPFEASQTPDGQCLEPPKTEQMTPPNQGLPTPCDSFKSPPPPANIASRRNIPRPATLNAASLRCRSYNMSSGPKTAVDGVRRTDPSSPVTAMRRIASSNGNMTGRIQKNAGPRSPMILNRTTEARLQYHARSPVGNMNATFSCTAPPTPMTPAVISHQGMREPTVSSSCSDDEAFMLSAGMSATNMMHDIRIESLKTPPSTPGLLGNLGAHPLNAGLDYSLNDQPLLTPYFQTEFTDLSIRHVPSYVDLSDASLPSTPLYPNMLGSGQEPGPFASMGGNAQYDWDANEPTTSCKSSPGQPKSRQIQFTPNITPQDYTITQER